MNNYLMRMIAAYFNLSFHQKFRIIGKESHVSPQWYEFKPSGVYTAGVHVMQEDILIGLITGAYYIFEREETYQGVF